MKSEAMKKRILTSLLVAVALSSCLSYAFLNYQSAQMQKTAFPAAKVSEYLREEDQQAYGFSDAKVVVKMIRLLVNLWPAS
jgi:hypothetical protein